MYKIFYTRKFKKSLKSISKSGLYDATSITYVINILSKGEVLEARFKDHYLKGDLSDFKECHVKNDLLLIYQKDEVGKCITLVDIGSHSKLLKS